MIEIKEETINAVRALNGLDAARTQASVLLLRQWLDKQHHLPKKQFSDKYLENTLINCKGSVERAKERLDKYCTIRTMLPQCFDKTNARDDFGEMHSILEAVACPSLTKDYNRIILLKLKGYPKNSEQLTHFYKYGILCAEYIKTHDYSDGIIAIHDFRDVNLAAILPKINIINLGQAISVQVEAFGLRLKQIHLLSASKVVHNLVLIVKQLLKKKLGERIHVHETVESLHEFVDKELLPSNYGGDGMTSSELHDAWIKLLSSEEHVAHMRSMQNARSLETQRPAGDFNSQYMGMPGSFRALNVD